MRPWRVVIADDHPYYRRGLVTSLRESGIEVVSEVANGDAAIRAVEKTKPDLVLMDLNMPGVSGVDATRRLNKLFPRTPVLMISVSAEEADVADAILAGATGYVLKESPPDEIVSAVREAAAGQAVISARLAALLLKPARDFARTELGSRRLAPSG